MNVIVTDTTRPSYLTVYPAGTKAPVASNLNWTAGMTVANLVQVPVGRFESSIREIARGPSVHQPSAGSR